MRYGHVNRLCRLAVYSGEFQEPPLEEPVQFGFGERWENIYAITIFQDIWRRRRWGSVWILSLRVLHIWLTFLISFVHFSIHLLTYSQIWTLPSCWSAFFVCYKSLSLTIEAGFILARKFRTVYILIYLKFCKCKCTMYNQCSAKISWNTCWPYEKPFLCE